MEHSWKNKRVLVTGADGFIGSTLALKLLLAGAEVHAVVGTRSTLWRLGKDTERMHMLSADLADVGEARRVIAESKPDIVFNLASSTNATRDFSLASEVLHGTYDLCRAVIDACVEAKVERFVQFGSIEEYGTAATPYDEQVREEPVSPYSLGKVMTTHYALLAGALTGMKVTVVRPAATFGPKQGPGMLIPNLIRSGLAGKDFDMNDGMQERDFIYVDDLIEGVLRAGSEEKAQGQIFNLGSGHTRSVRAVVEEIVALLGNPIAVHFGAVPPRPLERPVVMLDSRKAKAVLGWEPKTDFTEALTQTVDWYQKHRKEAGIV